MTNKTKQYGLWAGLLLCSVAVVSAASSLVTFQVDMSTAGFDPNTQTVEVRGNFNNWGNGGVPAFPLTNNPSGPNPSLWTGTTNLPLNGSVIAFKYVIQSGTTYESSHNRLATLPSTSGGSLIIPPAYYNDTPPAPFTCSVTFQVDLAQQINTGAFIPDTSTAQARGLFNGWGGSAVAQTNDPTILRTNQFNLVTSNVYVYTYDISGSPGQTLDYKYYIDTGANWEAPAPGTGDPGDNNNRFFTLSSNATQVLPIVFFGDAPYAPVATNDVTFQVDMSSQILVGNFDPSTGTVEVRGNFNSWGAPQILCTNDLSALNTNLYKAVVSIVDGVGAFKFYKFYASVTANAGWEVVAGDPGLNRSFKIINGPPNPTPLVLPPVFFSDTYIDPNDVLPADTLVTFTVNMTNAVGTDAHVFDPINDTVHINGDFYNNWNGGVWDTSLPQVTNNPVGSGLYQITVLIPKGKPLSLAYQYSINGAANETTNNQNHVRYIRMAGAYTLPLDTFGTMYSEPVSFGELAASSASTGHVQVSWLGRPGVHLQTKADLSSGTWQDLLNTDGAGWSNGYMSANGFISVTNYPTSGGKSFFRLVKP